MIGVVYNALGNVRVTLWRLTVQPDPLLMRAREGRWRWPWVIAGMMLTIVVAFALLVAGSVLEEIAGLSENSIFAPYDLNPEQPHTFVDEFLFFAIVLFAPLITLRAMHGVSWRRGFSYGTGFDWRLLFRAGLAYLLAMSVTTGLALYIEPQNFRLQPRGLDYIPWFVLGLGVIFVQCLAEEVLVKGYLLRVWGAVLPFRLPITIVVLTLFVAAHSSNSDITTDLWFNLFYFTVSELISFAMFFRTQNLAASAGLHWMNNVYAFMLLPTVPGRSTHMALGVYTDPVLSAGGSYLFDPFAHVMYLLHYAVLLLLLLLPSSPFYLPKASQPFLAVENETTASNNLEVRD